MIDCLRRAGTPSLPPSGAVWLRPALLSLALVSAGCSTIYYSVWESLGKEKRDLLRDNVEAVREDQTEVSEQFASTLERIKELYGLDGGDLEKIYDQLSGEYDDSQAKAEALRDRIDTVEDIAGDLFAEWEAELDQISDANLRSRSRQQLRATQSRYRELESALHASEERLEPVLVKMNDQVLFLKHNLNAQAIGSLDLEASDIEAEVADLIADLRVSIQRADEFIEGLPE
ncbi:MAG: DUF2959 domain-containing protein [Acidobacteriota bacterium]